MEPKQKGLPETGRAILRKALKEPIPNPFSMKSRKPPNWPEFTMIFSSLPGLFNKLHYYLGTTEPQVKLGWLDSTTCFFFPIS